MRHDYGFTLIELLIVVAVIGILAAVAIPGLIRARMSGNEGSAIVSLRTIASAEMTYASTCGRGGYAQRLADLGRPIPAGTEFVGPDLAQDPSLKSGYEFVLASQLGATQVAAAAQTCNGSVNPSVSAFWAGARPIQVGATGQRAFAVDARAGIFEAANGAVHIANPIPAGATPLK